MLRRWGPAIVLLAIMAIAIQQGWYRHLTLESLIAHEATLRGFVSAHSIAAVTAYAALYIAVVALSLPGGLLLTLAGGYLFGWLVAGPVTVLAATAGATVVFLIARSSLGAALAERAGPRLGALQEGFRENALSYLLFLRLVPLFPFWLVNIAPALLAVPLRTYVAATIIGIVPGTFVFAFLGAGLDSVVLAQRASFEACRTRAAAENLDPASSCHLDLDPATLLTPGLIAALIALGLLALVPVAAKKVLGGRATR